MSKAWTCLKDVDTIASVDPEPGVGGRGVGAEVLVGIGIPYDTVNHRTGKTPGVCLGIGRLCEQGRLVQHVDGLLVN